jgi:hypothetical protein
MAAMTNKNQPPAWRTPQKRNWFVLIFFWAYVACALAALVWLFDNGR